MSIINFLAIAIISVFASIVYEFTVISRFVACESASNFDPCRYRRKSLSNRQFF
jgi:hypothetical protein